MTILYSAPWILPVSAPAIVDGAVAVAGETIISIGSLPELSNEYPQATVRKFPEAVLIPGLINAHSHLELTAMRGFLESEEADFFGWLKKLTIARLERMTAEDRFVSAVWGACEAVRAGVTCVADASESAAESMNALKAIGLRGIVFQESFGPDPHLAKENLEKLRTRVSSLRDLETSLVKCGVSPHAPYTVSAPQLRLISEYALEAGLPLMMHAAETAMEVSLMHDGDGPFAEGLRNRGISWQAPGVSPIKYLNSHGVLRTKPLLAHCVNVDDEDLEIFSDTGARVAHCPKSNAKLGNGVAPFAKFLNASIPVGLGSDSVASNNTCDLLEEARFALLTARNLQGHGDSRVLTADEALYTATVGGARAVGLEAQVGELKPGKQADFAVVSLNGTHQIPSYDLTDSLIFSSSGRDVILTVVAGREVYREGRVISVDEEELRGRMRELAGKLALTSAA